MTFKVLLAAILAQIKFPIPPALPTFVDNETPVVDPTSSDLYNLANTPIVGSLKVFMNGIRMTYGQDFSLTGKQITFDVSVTPAASDILVAEYRF